MLRSVDDYESVFEPPKLVFISLLKLVHHPPTHTHRRALTFHTNTPIPHSRIPTCLLRHGLGCHRMLSYRVYRRRRRTPGHARQRVRGEHPSLHPSGVVLTHSHTPQQTRFERPVNPALFGRPLEPFDFGVEEGRSQRAGKPSKNKAKAAQKKQQHENTPPRPVKDNNKLFAGPGLYTSPPPSAVPMPPAFLLSS